MDYLVEVVATGGALLGIAAGTVAWVRNRVSGAYQHGRAYRLRADYRKADETLFEAANWSRKLKGIMSPVAIQSDLLRFWCLIEQGKGSEAQKLLGSEELQSVLPLKPEVSVPVHEANCWLSLRYDSLNLAEQAAGKLLHATGDGARLPRYIYSSVLFTHGCLLIEEGSTKYAVERLSASSQIAKTTYGSLSMYAVPASVALAWLHFRNGHLEKSAKLLAHGLAVYSRELGADHPRTARVKAMLAFVAFAVGFFNESQQQMKESAAAFQKHGLQNSGDALLIRDAMLRLRSPS